MVVRASIWPLDGFDMFRLCNGRTEAIWSTKQTYEIGIVGHCMLVRERECRHNVRVKKLMVLVEAFQGFFDGS